MQAKNKIQRKIIAYTPVFLCFRDDLNLVNLLKFNGEFLANYIHAQEIIVRHIFKRNVKYLQHPRAQYVPTYTISSHDALIANHCV